MQIVETGRGYELSFPYHPHTVAMVKGIPGSKFIAGQKYWLVPRESKEFIDDLLKRYGFKGDKGGAEIIGEIEDLPELTIDIPLKMPLFHYQTKGVAKGLELKRFINGDMPGLGKTAQSIATVLAANAFPCLVICPSSLKENWKREWENKWTDKRCIILEDKVKNTWMQYWNTGMAQVFITNYESLKKYFVQDIQKPSNGRLTLKNIAFKNSINLFKSVIIDEMHRCKDGTTQQSKFVMGVTRGKEYIIGLTGTPVVNKPKDLIAQLYIIEQLESFGGYKNFIMRYCEGGNGATNLRELNYLLNKNCFYRREKSEVLKDLPAKMRQVMLCNIATRDEYRKAEQEFVQYLKENGCSDKEIAKNLRGEIMVKIGILKNISARGKMAEVIEHVEEVVDAGEKIIVFCHLKEVAKSLKAQFPTAVSVTGDDNQEARQRAVDSFQNEPKTQVIICSIKAAGVGLTLTASSRVAFVELPWHPADCDQCEDRAHRIGQKDSVQVTYFLGKNTIDERIYQIIDQKRDVSNAITGANDHVQTDIVDSLVNLFQ